MVLIKKLIILYNANADLPIHLFHSDGTKVESHVNYWTVLILPSSLSVINTPGKLYLIMSFSKHKDQDWFFRHGLRYFSFYGGDKDEGGPTGILPWRVDTSKQGRKGCTEIVLKGEIFQLIRLQISVSVTLGRMSVNIPRQQNHFRWKCACVCTREHVCVWVHVHVHTCMQTPT